MRVLLSAVLLLGLAGAPADADAGVFGKMFSPQAKRARGIAKARRERVREVDRTVRSMLRPPAKGQPSAAAAAGKTIELGRVESPPYEFGGQPGHTTSVVTLGPAGLTLTHTTFLTGTDGVERSFDRTITATSYKALLRHDGVDGVRVPRLSARSVERQVIALRVRDAMGRGVHGDAQQILRRALVRHYADAELKALFRVTVGNEALADGHREKARRSYERALEIDPTCAEATDALAAMGDG